MIHESLAHTLNLLGADEEEATPDVLRQALKMALDVIKKLDYAYKELEIAYLKNHLNPPEDEVTRLFSVMQDIMLNNVVNEANELEQKAKYLQIANGLQERRNAGEIIEKRKSVVELALELGLERNTLSGYITQLRKAEAKLPEDERRIKTPPRGRYSYDEELAIRAFISRKNERPTRRKQNVAISR